MNIYAASSLAGFLINTAIGIFVYLQNRTNKTNRLFGFFCLTIDFWLFGCFAQSLLPGKEWSLFFDKLLYTGVGLCPAIYLHFVTTMVDLKSKRRLLNMAYLISLGFLTINYVPSLRKFLIVDVVQKYSFRFIAIPGILWYLLISVFAIYAVYEFIIIYKAQRRESGHKQMQLKYLFAATVIINIAGSMYFLLLLNIVTPPIDNLLVVIYGGIMAYAIVRHQLMEIEVIIKRTIVFTGLFASILGIVIGVGTLTQNLIFDRTLLDIPWTHILFSFIIMFVLYDPLKGFLIRITDRFLFQKKYDYRKLLHALSQQVMTIMELDKLTMRMVDDLVNIIRLESCAILLFNKDKEIYEVVASKGLKDKKVIFRREDPMISFLKTTHINIIKGKHIERMDDRDTIKGDMRKLNAEIILPLIIRDDLIGVLSLGMKKSGEEYSQDDIVVLESLAGTASVAISNALYVINTMRLEAQAAQREKMALIGTLSAGINHEICNPLGIARGQCEVFLLNAREGLYKERSKEEQIYEAMKIMEKVIKETDRATAITKRLSIFAKPGSGNINEDVDIADEINEALELVRHELELEKIKLIKDIPDNLSHISADRKQIHEVFFNIIRNAGQAIKGGGKITVKAREDKKDNKIIVEIEDTGHGISEDKLEAIFNPFYTTKAPGKGTGLGLFVVRQVVHRNKGTISVKSKVGKGTKFTLCFRMFKK